MTHQHPVKVYYEDTDAGGVLNHAQYINFCERGRTELLNACDYKSSELQDKEGIMFVVRHIEADYIKAGFLEDELIVHTAVGEMKNSSFIMNQSITRDGETIFKQIVTLVCVNTNPVKATRIPNPIREAFLNYNLPPSS